MTSILCTVAVLCLFALMCDMGDSYGITSMHRTNVGSMTMKKGRKVPINQRGEYMKQLRIMQEKKQLEGNVPDNVPIFKLFVRLKTGSPWLPCGDLAGDQRATALVNAWTAGFMEGMYKSQLDKGVARSVFQQGDQFKQNIIENYSPFKKCRKEDLQFGYTVKFDSLTEKKGDIPITILEEGMEKGWLDNAKEQFGGLFGGK